MLVLIILLQFWLWDVYACVCVCESNVQDKFHGEKNELSRSRFNGKTIEWIINNFSTEMIDICHPSMITVVWYIYKWARRIESIWLNDSIGNSRYIYLFRNVYEKSFTWNKVRFGNLTWIQAIFSFRSRIQNQPVQCARNKKKHQQQHRLMLKNKFCARISIQNDNGQAEYLLLIHKKETEEKNPKYEES